MSLNFGKSPSMLLPNPPEIQSLNHSLFSEKGLELAILRLDQVHSLVSGNKFFKLKYNFEEAKLQGKDTLLTFGGAYSNHIHACAAAAKLEGFKAIGLIRGDFLEESNPTLNFAGTQGMELHFLDRETYRQKSNPEFLQTLEEKYGDFYLIPEGGTNPLAIQGTSEILGLKTRRFTHICTSIGTGGTFLGLAASLEPRQKLLGFSSLKGNFIHQEIQEKLLEFQVNSKGSLEVFSSYHFGGYAKWTPELIDFIHWFYSEFGIILDPVYTGKMAFGIFDLIQKNQVPPGSKVLLIHTGGLQGNLGFIQRTGISLPILSA